MDLPQTVVQRPNAGLGQHWPCSHAAPIACRIWVFDYLNIVYARLYQSAIGRGIAPASWEQGLLSFCIKRQAKRHSASLHMGSG